MSMSRSEKRIVGMLRAVGRMRATISHGITQWGKQVDDELLAMAKELEALRGEIARKPEDKTDGVAAEASPRKGS